MPASLKMQTTLCGMLCFCSLGGIERDNDGRIVGAAAFASNINLRFSLVGVCRPISGRAQ